MSAATTAKDRFADYVPVSERLEQFYSDHPDGRILTAIVEHDAEHGFVLMRAEVYREKDDALPIATGHAFENRTEGYVNKTSYIENCETSATGRALALAGYEIKRGIASKEEMQKAERMGNGSGGQANAEAMTCPDCGEAKAVIKGKAEYGGGYLCFKKKGGCGAKWGFEPKTEGFGTDAALRDELFAQAEKFMIAKKYPEEKRKEALGRLVALTTEEMGKAVDKLVTGGKPDEEAERQKTIAAIRKAAKPDALKRRLDEFYEGKKLESLSLDALNEEYDWWSEDIPF